MANRSHPAVADRDDPCTLLGLLEDFPEPVVVGFRPTRRRVELHVAPLPPDARTGAAGLFGLTADPGWSAVGVAFAGRARQLRSGTLLDDRSSAAVVVTRSGRCASWVRSGDDPTGGERVEGGAGGIVVDALHRILGLPSPGEPPSPALLAATVWAHEILELLLIDGSVGWDDALTLHPGEPGAGPVGPSDEMLLEATRRFAADFDWAAMHARAASGAVPVHELTTREAAWMDATMFARWVIGSLPDPFAVVDALRGHQCHEVAGRLEALLAALDAGATAR